MKLFSLLLGAALVSGASAAACDTCRGAFTATCTSKTVDLTCVALATTAKTGKGNFLDKTAAAAPECKACEDVNTKTCTSATVATACHTGYFINGAGKCRKCHAACGVGGTCKVEATPANNKCIVCGAGKFGGGTAGAACADCESAGAQLSTPVTCSAVDKALTCAAGSILSNHATLKSCVKCSAGTKTCTADTTNAAGGGPFETMAKTLSVTCLPGFFKDTTNAALPVCTTCESGAGAADLSTPATCTDGTKALTCPAAVGAGVGSILSGHATLKSCVTCSARTLTCTAKDALETTISTISTKCLVGSYLKAGTPATCVTCADPTCAAGTVAKGSNVAGGTTHYGCDGTTTAAPTKTTGCEPCAAGAATCTAVVATKAPLAAKTCKTGFTLRAVGLAPGTKCLAGAFGDNVPECVADCAKMDGKANLKACGCGKATYCTDGQGCTVDKTKIATVAGKCAKVQAPAKKSPASAMQASALLSAAALLVAMRQ